MTRGGFGVRNVAAHEVAAAAHEHSGLADGALLEVSARAALDRSHDLGFGVRRVRAAYVVSFAFLARPFVRPARAEAGERRVLAAPERRAQHLQARLGAAEAHRRQRAACLVSRRTVVGPTGAEPSSVVPPSPPQTFAEPAAYPSRKLLEEVKVPRHERRDDAHAVARAPSRPPLPRACPAAAENARGRRGARRWWAAAEECSFAPGRRSAQSVIDVELV